MMSKNSMVIFITLFMALWFSDMSLGLDRERIITEYMIDAWNTDSGLPTNSIVTLLQTSDGYLWIGTEEGLIRFDGVTFTIFDENNTPEITNNYINCLFEDSNKNLWIGIRHGGVVTYKNGNFKLYSKKDGFLKNLTKSITEGPGGAIWIGTEGLYKFQDNKFTLFTQKDGLPDDSIGTIYKDSKENLWIGTLNGLCCLTNNQFTHYDIKKDTEENKIWSICEDKNGILWIGTEKGLFQIRNKTIIATPFNANFPGMRVDSIFKDNGNNIWIGTETQGIFRYKPTNETFENLSKVSGLSDNTIRVITGDKEGSIWIGSVYGGLNRLRDSKFKVFGVREGLADDIVFTIAEDSNHYVWIGTYNGLTRVKDDIKKPINFNTGNGLSNNVVDTIYEDHSGSIWVGTDNGLNQLQNSPSKIQKVSQYAFEGNVLAIMEDTPGNLWVGTNGGLFKKEKNSANWQKINLEIDDEKGEYFKHVNIIYEDSKKNLWFSASSRGLVKLSGNTFTVYNEKDGLSCVSVQQIYEDNDNVFWFGTLKGLFRLKDDKFTHFTIKDGLFNNNIYKILEDSRGNLWISCNRGIFSVSKKDLNDYADDKIAYLHYTAYSKDDGMRSFECNGGMQTAGCKTSDGRLWFPTTQGIVVIDPEKLAVNKLPPPVINEQVLLDGVPIALGEEIKVNPGVKRIDFRYTALSLRLPKRVKFKYRLEGYSNEWLDAGTQRIATYTNLDAGDYRFQVTACNDDGLWNEKGAAINFSVIPSFTDTWLFRILALTVFAVFSYLVINFINKYINLVQFWKRYKYIGKFKILDKLGSGGMGTVYKAENTIDRGEKVAIKVLREEFFDDDKSRKRFRQEAAIIDQLDHPNIIKIYERGQSHHSMYIAMELLEGKTLTKKIEDEGTLNLFESLHIMSQVTDAVAKIHSKDIVHRDMKPDNVMLIKKDNDPEFVKLLDFGLAKMQHQTRLTQTGMVIGTINYMAPEQIAGTEATSATDIYSIGVMFYEMLTGRKPFMGETSIDIMKEIIEKHPIEPIKYRPEIPLELNDLIMRMMGKKMAERPITEEVLQNLQIISSKIDK